MKNFKQLTVDDLVYEAYEGDTDYKTEVIIRVEKEYGFYKYGDTFKRSEKTRVRVGTRHNRSFYLFSNEVEAMRYCKAQTVKKINRLINQANEAIDMVKKFRASKIDLLNNEWTEAEINKLEKKLQGKI